MDKEPKPESSLDTIMLDGRSLSEWHQFLTTGKHSGLPTGHLEVPASRYGRTANEVAWYAVAAGLVQAQHVDDSETAQALDFLMNLAVNDHQDIADMVTEGWESLPPKLQEQLWQGQV